MNKIYHHTRAYCHTSYVEYEYIKGNWYDVYHETNGFFILQYFRTFHKDGKEDFLNDNGLFSKYFFTEQEYNRYKNLNDLLDKL